MEDEPDEEFGDWIRRSRSTMRVFYETCGLILLLGKGAERSDDLPSRHSIAKQLSIRLLS